MKLKCIHSHAPRAGIPVLVWSMMSCTIAKSAEQDNLFLGSRTEPELSTRDSHSW